MSGVRYVIEVRTCQFPVEEWVVVNDGDEADYHFTTKEVAEKRMARLKRAQPHVEFRVKPVSV